MDSDNFTLLQQCLGLADYQVKSDTHFDTRLLGKVDVPNGSRYVIKTTLVDGSLKEEIVDTTLLYSRSLTHVKGCLNYYAVTYQNKMEIGEYENSFFMVMDYLDEEKNEIVSTYSFMNGKTITRVTTVTEERLNKLINDNRELK